MRTATLDASRVASDFPILRERVNGHRLVYLDNAASSQKPEVVIDAISDYYRTANANVHRGVHALGERATEVFEGARVAVARLVGAEPRGVIFVRNTTEGINLVAQAFARERFGPADRIVCTEMEHHSNLVPGTRPAASWSSSRSPPTGNWTWRRRRDCSSRQPGWCPSRTSAMSWGRSTRSPSSSSGRTARESWCASTGLRRCPICRSISKRWTPTSTRSPATRCAARPGSGSSMGGLSCSRPWSRS